MAQMMRGALAAEAEPDDNDLDEAMGVEMEDDDADEASGEQENKGQGQGEEGGSESRVNPQMVEAVQLVAARAQDALASMARDLDAALKADPVRAAVEFGVRALRGVVGAAEQAGKQLPFEVVLNAGIVVIQVIADIANQKGYLADDDIEPFLKEVFQQSVAAYAKLDARDGKLGQKDMQAVQAAMNRGA